MPNTHPTGRPSTTAEMLERVASFLDAGEAAFRRLERMTGEPILTCDGKSVQQDLRTLAAQLSARPELDAQVYALLPN